MLVVPRMGMPKMDMLGMVGTMVAQPGGAAQALGGVMHVMPVTTRMHPRKPALEGGAMAVVGILMGHLVFGLVVALVYGTPA